MLDSEPIYKLLKIKVVCGRGDSNPHALASVSPSSWCVCQFRHFRIKGSVELSVVSQLGIGFGSAAANTLEAVFADHRH